MSLRKALNDSLVSGLILVTPLVVTLVVLRVLVGWTLGFVNPIVQGTRLATYTGNVELLAQVIATVLIVILIVLLGYVAQRSAGKRAFGSVGRFVDFIPLVSTVYTSVRRITTSLVDREGQYESVVLIEYPREGLYAIGLVTAGSPREVETVTGETAYNVFLPNSPNPTAGRLVVVPESGIHEIDVSIRRGMRMIVTTGVGEEEDALPPAVQDIPE
ncbi:MAG: DUF502 domain-containing protein [Halobacteriales archaeon]